MTKPLLIAASVALALSVTACGREDRADANRTAPGANVATTPQPSSPVDSGGTTGAGAGGMTSGGAASASSSPAISGSGPDQTGGPGASYGTQSSVPPTGTPSAGAGSAAGSGAGTDTTAR